MASHRQFNIRPRRAGKTTMLVEDYLTHIQSADTLDGKNGILLIVHNRSWGHDLTHDVKRRCEELGFSEELTWYAKEHIRSIPAVLHNLNRNGTLDASPMGPGLPPRNGHIDKLLLDEYLMWQPDEIRKINDFLVQNPRIGYRVETTGKEILDREVVYLTRFFREYQNLFDVSRLDTYIQKTLSVQVDKMWNNLITDPSNKLRADFHDWEAMMEPNHFYLSRGGIWSTDT